MTVLIDDHLLRDWLAGPDDRLTEATDGESLATTNLWYARLCKSAARTAGGALVGDWPLARQRALAESLIALPATISILPMRQLAWRMGELCADHNGLSALGSEAVAAAARLAARILVSSRDDGPGIRACCQHEMVRYDALTR